MLPKTIPITTPIAIPTAVPAQIRIDRIKKVEDGVEDKAEEVKAGEEEGIGTEAEK